MLKRIWVTQKDDEIEEGYKRYNLQIKKRWWPFWKTVYWDYNKDMVVHKYMKLDQPIFTPYEYKIEEIK